MDTEQIISLIEAVSASGLGEFEYQQGGVKLALKAKTPVCVAPSTVAMADAQMTASIAPTTGVTVVGNNEEAENTAGEVITSPLVGTFYSAPAEGEAPYISVGDTIKKGQIIGIIETMKLMNEVESDRDGVVTAILIENEQVVEFGQPLVAIK